MGNSFFKFKQFIVHQDKCAMKVTTDACVFGAIIADRFRNVKGPILDIGTGTGLLSLMLAQKNNVTIDAVEIDTAAYEQAVANFNASPWAARLQASNIDARFIDSAIKYDAVISNPPFFEHDLSSPDAQKNAAKHDTTLTLQTLIDIVKEHLRENGLFAVLLPTHRTAVFIQQAADAGLFLSDMIMLKQTVGHDHFRSILLFSTTTTGLSTAELAIKDAHNRYTPAFVALLQDYYLYL